MEGTKKTHEQLAARPRVTLGHWPTPLEPCHRLRAEIGGPLVWLKRDDCSGLAMGGNKTRKLEFLLGAAIAGDATGVVTFGALQSNHARQTAAGCAAVGLPCHLVLTASVDRGDAHYRESGNVLLDRILGATLHVVPDADAALVRAGELLEADAGLHLIEPGGSNPVGTLGYVGAAAEMIDQADALGIDPSTVVVAASSGGTAAGLSIGLQLAGRRARVLAAAVYESADATTGTVERLVSATGASLGAAVDTSAVTVSDRFLGAGYGVPSPASRHAIELLATTEGVLLDPVYTSKAFALLLDDIGSGIDGADDVVFVHTGGQAGLFAYAPDFSGGG